MPPLIVQLVTTALIDSQSTPPPHCSWNTSPAARTAAPLFKAKPLNVAPLVKYTHRTPPAPVPYGDA